MKEEEEEEEEVEDQEEGCTPNFGRNGHLPSLCNPSLAQPILGARGGGVHFLDVRPTPETHKRLRRSEAGAPSASPSRRAEGTARRRGLRG